MKYNVQPSTVGEVKNYVEELNNFGIRSEVKIERFKEDEKSRVRSVIITDKEIPKDVINENIIRGLV